MLREKNIVDFLWVQNIVTNRCDAEIIDTHCGCLVSIPPTNYTLKATNNAGGDFHRNDRSKSTKREPSVKTDAN